MEQSSESYSPMETESKRIKYQVTEKIGIGFGLISSPEMNDEQAEIEAAEITRFVTAIDRSNPAVCIDGRHLADGETPLPLGAHLAGGAETALVAAKSVGYPLQGSELIGRLRELGFVMGGHDADSNKQAGYEGGTGCGACDKCAPNCDLFESHKEDVGPTVELLMGADFDQKTYDSVKLAPVDDRLSDVVDSDLIETLHDDHEGVHGHREFMVVFNYVKNTTIDRDAYYKATGKQVFVVDMWYIKDLAESMAEDAGNPEIAKDLQHSMVEFQVATYLGLCDGSHRALVIQSEDS